MSLSYPSTKQQKEHESSSKIKAAIKWKIPFVRVGWLYKCLETLTKVDTEPFEDEVVLNRAQLKRKESIEKSVQEIAENVNY